MKTGFHDRISFWFYFIDKPWSIVDYFINTSIVNNILIFMTIWKISFFNFIIFFSLDVCCPPVTIIDPFIIIVAFSRLNSKMFTKIFESIRVKRSWIDISALNFLRIFRFSYKSDSKTQLAWSLILIYLWIQSNQYLKSLVPMFRKQIFQTSDYKHKDLLQLYRDWSMTLKTSPISETKMFDWIILLQKLLSMYKITSN